jgi:hypothetical protein
MASGEESKPKKKKKRKLGGWRNSGGESGVKKKYQYRYQLKTQWRRLSA